jgi:hypothetical protein
MPRRAMQRVCTWLLCAAASRPMVDIIVGVTDAARWHDENMARNPSHYTAAARFLGPSVVAWLQVP